MVDRTKPAGPESGVGRRRFLTYLVAAPVLTVATGPGFEEASAAPRSGMPDMLPQPSKLPQVGNVLDLGDALRVASAPTTALMVLEVGANNRVRFELPRAEVGQGITTAAVMLVAEELDVSVDDVDITLSDARPELLFNQFTGASTSVRTLWDPVRTMAAAARARLVTAAAKRWNVAAGGLTTRNATVVAPDGRSASYGSLSADATHVVLPAVASTPKPASAYKVVGKPTHRIDARDIVTGKAKYALDLSVPGALPTVVARPPTIGGKLASADASAARAMPGVVAVTKIPNGVAVCAETFDQAMKARDKLSLKWSAGPADGLSDSDIRKRLSAAIDPFPAGSETGQVTGTFDFAFVPHAAMEVLSAVADVRSGHAELWFATQTPIVAQQDIANELGLPQRAVKVHVTRAGGSFGLRLFYDVGLEAALISKAVGKPVKLMWTRNDDMRHARLRPPTHHSIRAKYASGKVLSFEHRMSSVEVDFKHGLGEALTAAGVNVAGNNPVGQVYFDLSETMPYNFGSVSQTLREISLPFPTSSFRSVYSGTMRTVEEIMVDQLAKQMGKDPVQFRLQFLSSKGAQVVKTAADEGKWGRSLPKGWAQGIGYHEEYQSRTACLVEMNATDPKAPRVTKAVVAVDVGRPVNPRGLQAQMMGGLMDAISTVLQAGVHIDNGAVREGSYGDFHYARQRNAPVDLEIHVLPATGDPGGAGELGVPAAAGAVANAYARATGTTPHQFPINF
jgi:isoquinoline 1-oxidoreductase subunit beta